GHFATLRNGETAQGRIVLLFHHKQCICTNGEARPAKPQHYLWDLLLLLPFFQSVVAVFPEGKKERRFTAANGQTKVNGRSNTMGGSVLRLVGAVKEVSCKTKQKKWSSHSTSMVGPQSTMNAEAIERQG
ncbi:hypothetical protein TcG_08870, partial [Trypanosoma cruzi]